MQTLNEFELYVWKNVHILFTAEGKQKEKKNKTSPDMRVESNFACTNYPIQEQRNIECFCLDREENIPIL